MLTKAQYQAYIYGSTYDGERLQLEHKLFKPHFKAVIEQVLDEYGLAAHLQAAREQGERTFGLDIGCGEGLFLHDVADSLEKRGLLDDNLALIGLDKDDTAIGTAEDFRRLSKPVRSQLHFYQYDANQPLEDCYALRQFHQPRFDFIYLTCTLEHLPHAQTRLAYFYSQLKPGGVIYVRDTVKHDGPDGWLVGNVLAEPYTRLGMNFVASVNGGIDTSQKNGDWLKELGAAQVQTSLDRLEVGGNTQAGLDMLRNTIMMVRNISPHMLAAGLVTQADHDKAMQFMFHEITADYRGQLSYTDTLARRPLSA